MGFSTALSGLNAASKDLQVTGNNIANANTTGFKESRTEFADVYAASVTGVSKTQAGAGAKVANVAQQFNQGNLTFTNNNLDLAISGQGFFSLAEDPAASKPTLFSRGGEFKLNKDGYVVNNQGAYLQSFKPNGTTVEEGFSEGVFQPLKINASQGAPKATSEILINTNLNATEITPVNFGTVPDVPVDPSDPKSYNHTSSVTTYDSQGNSHIASMYYVSKNPATPNQWDAYFFVDGVPFNPNPNATPAVPAVKAEVGTPHVPMQLDFDANGALNLIDGAAPGKLNFGAITSTDIDPTLNVAPLDFNFDFATTTQYSANFSVQDLSQDGLPAGNLTGISINDEGVVSANFSNGGADILGKIALTRFANPQGLTKTGDTAWRESVESGEAVAGQPKSGSFGSIQSGALESSNVDLSAQLVHLIIAQQAYQANAQTITTEKTIMQTILNA
ncbi:flagellar hook protein FlgE [methanotrophic endosymbiont of Bathymodiolus puteoserpentis (Logatchev)]|jgi:flagellar hook protein FlgE|uniref:flagellar hook protein FlgE n=1 Tax=methanotrophic endosymbiont of Bathymodiolus puteoserpentis (Logatchev) TaxID=343235 RepID=UPI0013C76CF9|nr:flagellar hook protein FlgE [methanotrophic endosymbiont of Bathymodiolus puteoserpentis (Logatchev)]SHE22871.1 Flagellar hook protein FlgE [methanotrophic endosymbiont of Bathymodiolus puteoserpentis (Logatchev)]